MAWIRTIDPTDADPNSRLGRLYRGSKDTEHGGVDNILTVHGLRPDTLDGHLKLYRAVLHPRHPDGLSRRERELVGVAVSAANGCHY